MVWQDRPTSPKMSGMPRARTLLPSAGYVVLAITDSVAAGKSGSTRARRLRYVVKPVLMPALATAFLGGTQGRGAREGTDLLHTATAVAQAFSWGGDVALLGTSKTVVPHRCRVVLRGSRRLHHRVPVRARRRQGLRHRRSQGRARSVADRRSPDERRSRAQGPGTPDPGRRLRDDPVRNVRELTHARPRVVARSAEDLQTGTALFLISDSVLAAQKFLLAQPRPVLESVVMATYTAGQALIALGVSSAI